MYFIPLIGQTTGRTNQLLYHQSKPYAALTNLVSSNAGWWTVLLRLHDLHFHKESNLHRWNESYDLTLQFLSAFNLCTNPTKHTFFLLIQFTFTHSKAAPLKSAHAAVRPFESRALSVEEFPLSHTQPRRLWQRSNCSSLSQTVITDQLVIEYQPACVGDLFLFPSDRARLAVCQQSCRCCFIVNSLNLLFSPSRNVKK